MIRPEQEQLDAFNKLLKMWHSRMNGIIVYEASQVEIHPESFTFGFHCSLM